MSTRLPPRPPKLHLSGAPRFAIVASEYNPDFVQSLVNHTCQELYQIDDNCIVELFSVSGSFEIPVTCEMVARQQRHDVIIALGVIIQGKTKHADFIGSSVSHALQDVAIKHAVPVIHEVLVVNSDDEARERCGDGPLNRGLEAARAAFVMQRLRDSLKKKSAAAR